MASLVPNELVAEGLINAYVDHSLKEPPSLGELQSEPVATFRSLGWGLT
jgi:hypothetical protein